VPGFDTISDQQQPIGLLKTFIAKGNIPHALLFSGIEGVGKRTAALLLAMARLCQGKDENRSRPQLAAASEKARDHQREKPFEVPCTRCRACRRIASGTHPDVLEVQPSGAFIRIGQIRSLCETLALKPFEGGPRVVLIVNAQAMNAEAGNALLKVLEEPPDQTTLVLTALQTTDLLPTIVSRCQQVRFNPVSRESIARVLMEQDHLAPEAAGIVAALAQGSVGRAKKMAATDWLDKRRWLLAALGLAPGAGMVPPSPRQGLAVAEKLAQDKQALEDSLQVVKTWLRDVLVCTHAPHLVIHQDQRDLIAAAAGRLSAGRVLDQIQAVSAAQRAISANANVRLTLDVMALRLTGHYPPSMVAET
jgi:DNA polymerase-3 subunit delta'